MKQESAEKNWLFFIFIALCVVMIGIVIATFFFDIQNTDNFISDNCYLFSDGWSIMDDSDTSDISIPCENISNSKTTTIQNKLREEYDYDLTVAIRTRHQFLKVYLGDDKEPIYVFDDNNSLFTATPGCAWHFIDVPEKYYGKEIKVEYTSVFKENYGEIQPILYGNGKGILLYMYRTNGIGIIISLLMFGLSGLLLTFYHVLREKDNTRKLLYLAMFTFVLAVWSMIETDIVQFYVREQEVINLVSYEMLLLISIPILLCIRESAKKIEVVIINILIIMLMLLFVVENLLVYLKIADFVELVQYTHISMIVSIVTVIATATGRLLEKDEVHNKRRLNANKFAFMILGISVIMDLINFYYKMYTDGATSSRIGVFFFIIILGISTMNEIYNITIMGEKVELWDKFAHEDVLTETNNRAAFEEEMQDIADKQSEEDKIAIMSIDINNLKKINDTYGHSEGDKYLKDCIMAIKKVIGDDVKLYRIGGDEFIILVRTYETGQIMRYISGFEEVLRNKDDKFNYPVSFAYGYAYYKYKTDADIYETLKRADKDMYDKKTEMKKKGVAVRV